MGVTNGLCGVNEFHDEVSGICGHCSDICRDITKPDSFCLYHCSGYYSRLLSTTVVSLQEEKSVTLLVPTVVPVVVFICIIVIMAVTYWYWRKCTHMHMQDEFAGRHNTNRKISKSRNRNRMSCHYSVQETRDPNKRGDTRLSVLCISPCSSLVLAAESETERMRFQPLAPDQLHLDRSDTRNDVTIDAIVSVRDMPSSSSELEETQPKFASHEESRCLSLNNKGSRELLKTLSNEEETPFSETNKTQSRLDNKDRTKHFDVAEESRRCSRHSGLDSSENAHTPVQESYALVSFKGGHS